ncbi:hypothetical protein [Pseudoalteromonas sp. TAB23]|uniref:hypothetical protein n=1 Tax=Pseudoalteromonas sp. TAB23 TaxID=1938595 RepID=UPI0004261151|nr:hypothetical protein [Pseudoalteromonas sp. TAB23]
MSDKFVVFDEDHVWGYGDTKEEALEEAKTWYENADNNFDRDFSSGNLQVASCSNDIIAFIERNSGNGVQLIKNKHDEAVIASNTGKEKYH